MSNCRGFESRLDMGGGGGRANVIARSGWHSRGVRGHAPPENFKFKASEMARNASFFNLCSRILQATSYSA